MKSFYVALGLFVVALIIWPKVMVGVILVLCVLGVAALLIGKHYYDNTHPK